MREISTRVTLKIPIKILLNLYTNKEPILIPDAFSELTGRSDRRVGYKGRARRDVSVPNGDIRIVEYNSLS
jgi:hypothetical protein